MVNNSSKKRITSLRHNSNIWLRSILKDCFFDKVLNLGCGTDEDKEGSHYFKYFKHREIIFVDIKRTNITTLVANAEYLPFEDNTFDFTFVNWLLHLETVNLSCILNEIMRVTKSGGKAMISYRHVCSGRFCAIYNVIATYMNIESQFTYACTKENDLWRGKARLIYGTVL